MSSSNVSKAVRLIGGRIDIPPNVGLVGSGVCEIKYHFDFDRARLWPPFPPERVKVEPDLQ